MSEFGADIAVARSSPRPALPPLVSIITPTYGREQFLRETWKYVSSQTHLNWEWLVLDDSPESCAWLTSVGDPRLRYLHTPERLSIGAKRNRLIAAARGDFIAHFDDDDYYAPQYVERMVGQLIAHDADFVHLCSWYLFDLRHDFFGFWALRQTTGLHYCCYADRVRLLNFTDKDQPAMENNYLGYGFTYVYRRTACTDMLFGDVNWCEETPFVDRMRERGKLLTLDDQTGMVLHVLHPRSSSSCFPQYHLPTFLLPSMFAAPSHFLGAMRRAQSESR